MSEAFGSPGINPKWTSSRKHGIGTSYDRSCHTWFTLGEGILTEIYYPTVDCPSTRELQFLVSDGESFCHEERCDLVSKAECPEEGVLYYRIESCDHEHRYLLVKEMITDPHASVFIMRATLIELRNSGGRHPARIVVGGDFLDLVRLGVREPNSALMRESIAVIDYVLKRELPGGRSWLRYNHDGYGQKANGKDYDGSGLGGAWPLLTGERGHYELAAGRSPENALLSTIAFPCCD